MRLLPADVDILFSTEHFSPFAVVVAEILSAVFHRLKSLSEAELELFFLLVVV